MPSVEISLLAAPNRERSFALSRVDKRLLCAARWGVRASRIPLRRPWPPAGESMVVELSGNRQNRACTSASCWLSLPVDKQTNPDPMMSCSPIQNMTYELALMKAGKGKVSGVSGLDDGPAAGTTSGDKEDA